MPCKTWSLLAVLAPALLLGACTSGRLAGPPVRAAVVAPVQPAVPEPVEAVPSGAVTAQPLPPLDGGPIGSAPPAPAESAPMDVAALPQPAPPVVPSGRSAVVGAWTARDAAGASCRVQLSSSPALDLYRASASGCANADLAKVSAWDYRDGEVYLYQPGGTVTARLRSSGGALDGVLAKSGAPLTLAR